MSPKKKATLKSNDLSNQYPKHKNKTKPLLAQMPYEIFKETKQKWGITVTCLPVWLNGAAEG